MECWVQMLLHAEPIFVAKGLVLADHRDAADSLLIIKTGAVEVTLAIDSKVLRPSSNVLHKKSDDTARLNQVQFVQSTFKL
jgi:hypothetical protein